MIRARSPFPVPVSPQSRMGGRRCVADCRSSCCTFSRTATIPRLTPRSWAGSAMASILRAVPPLQPSLNPDRHRGDVGPAPRTLHVRNLQRLQELHERPLEVGGESRAPRVPGVVVTRDPGIEKEELRLVGPPNRRRTWRLTVRGPDEPELYLFDTGIAGRSEEHTSELQSPCN